jgi:hypothetical protein
LDLDTVYLDNRENEHDGSEPDEESFGPRYDAEARAEVHAANRQARAALQALLKRLRVCGKESTTKTPAA